MTERKWVFPPAHHQSFGGESTGDIESMKADSGKTFIREMIQNSLDAKSDKSQKVEIVFSQFKTSRDDFPGRESFLDEAMQIEKALGSKSNDIKSNLVKTMIKDLDQLYIDWIRISDHGTTGLIGVSEPNRIEDNPWMSFTKGSGSSTKRGTQGGSKGIGKNSAFVKSSLRTLFVSTWTEKKECGFQGLSKLVSRQLENDYTSGFGFYGDQLLPEREYRSLDPKYSRDPSDCGTDIFIPCFRATENMEELIAQVAIDSFMPAIMDGTLVVKVNNSCTINNLTLKKYIAKYAGEKSIGKTIKAEYAVLTSKRPEVRIFEAPKGNKASMKLLIRVTKEGEPTNRVYIYRKPGIKVHTVSLDSDYACDGVLLITGPRDVALLRCLENATHTKWDISVVPEEGVGAIKKDDVRQAQRRTTDFINESLEKIQGVTKNGRVGFKGVEGFFRDLDADEKDDPVRKSGLPSALVRVSDKPVRKKRPSVKKNTIVMENGPVDYFEPADGEFSDIAPSFGSTPAGNNKGSGGDYHAGADIDSAKDGDDPMMRPIGMMEARKVLLKTRDGYLLRFMLGISAIGLKIRIKKVGIDGTNESMPIISATCSGQECVLDEGAIKIDEVDRNTIYEIMIRSSEKHNYAWEVMINGYEK